MKTRDIQDVVIVGAGPAGVSAAMILGRCMRKVVLIDTVPETKAKPESERFVSFKGAVTPEFARVGRHGLRPYETVTCLHTLVDSVERCSAGFEASCSNRMTLTTRVLLLVSDHHTSLPEIPGAKEFHGTSLHQCPYCHGWEHRGRKIGVLGGSDAAVDLALKMLQWTSHVSLFTNGDELESTAIQRLGPSPVEVVPGIVKSLEGHGKHLKSVHLDDGTSRPCDALFYLVHRKYPASLATHLGCNLRHILGVSNRLPEGKTGIEGLFVAAVQTLNNDEMPMLAAAEGIKVAEAIHNWLLEADHSYLALQPT